MTSLLDPIRGGVLDAIEDIMTVQGVSGHEHGPAQTVDITVGLCNLGVCGTE